MRHAGSNVSVRLRSSNSGITGTHNRQLCQ